MLVLTRRRDESIVIGDGIVVTVVEVGRGRVRLGIVAPPSVSIRREEVHYRILQEESVDKPSSDPSPVHGGPRLTDHLANGFAERSCIHE